MGPIDQRGECHNKQRDAEGELRHRVGQPERSFHRRYNRHEQMDRQRPDE
jgi:hypothetical protein